MLIYPNPRYLSKVVVTVAFLNVFINSLVKATRPGYTISVFIPKTEEVNISAGYERCSYCKRYYSSKELVRERNDKD
jgi:hypothetical protein